jgi:Zn-dependent oligopeptidase
MTEDFKVSITGDIGGLKKAVGEAEKELSAFASKSRELKTAIAENTKISASYGQSLRELKQAFNSGAISQAKYKQEIVSLRFAEKETLAEMNMPKELVMHHRTPHFGHVFSGEG